MDAIVGRVKWFDATRGFGFLVSDEIDGDVLLHFSVLREHGRRSVPEGATIECVPVRLDRGLQAKKVLSIDASSALPQPVRSSIPVERTRGPQGARGHGRRVRAGGGQMVQPRPRLWFRQAARRVGRRGRVRAHGDGAHLASPELQPGQHLRGADRAERQGPDGRRAARARRLGLAATALIALIACSPQAPARTRLPKAPSIRGAQTGLHEVPLTIRSKNGVHRFTVEVAATPEQQERGLMFRKSLAGDRGDDLPLRPAAGSRRSG